MVHNGKPRRAARARGFALIAALTLALLFGMIVAAPIRGQTGGGLLGRYFDNANLTNPRLARIDPVVDFNWGQGSPAPSIAPNSFSVRWRGRGVPLYSETYTFIVKSEDGVRLWVKRRLLIDNWTDHPLHVDRGQIKLKAGKPVPIRLEYYNDSGRAAVSLEWRSPSQRREIIPSSSLLPPKKGMPDPTATPSAIATPSQTTTPTRSPTASRTATATRPATPSSSRTASRTATPTASWTPSETPSVTPTASDTPTVTATHTATATPTETIYLTPTPSITGTLSPTPTASVTPTFTRTPTPSVTPTRSRTPTRTSTGTRTRTPTRTSTGTRTRTPTASWTPTRSRTPTATVTRTRTVTSTPSITRTPTRTPTTSPLAGVWTLCAAENKTCSFSGTKTVRFGSQGIFVYRTLASPVLCSTTVFGDPIFGVVKHCDYQDAFLPLAPLTADASFYGLDAGPGSASFRVDTLTLERNTGASRLRLSADWVIVEPVRDQYTFAGLDAVVYAALSAGFSPLVYITNNPGWAANTPCGPIDTSNPSIVGEFSDLVYALASRYPGVTLWSLYNEPDNSVYAKTGYTSGGCFGDDTTNDINHNGVNDRVDYARMLATAWSAIHRANPRAQLAMGALAYEWFDPISVPPWYPRTNDGRFNFNFLGEVLTYIQLHPLPAGQRYVDAMMFNYYDLYLPFWERVAAGKGIQAKTAKLQEQVSAYGFQFPMFVTETGMDSRQYGDQAQAICTVTQMVRGNVVGLQSVFWWTARDKPTAGNYYGLLTDTLGPKPAFYAFQTLTRQLDGLSFTAALKGTTGFTGIEAYQYQGGTTTRTVLWSAVIPTGGSALCGAPRTSKTAIFGPNVARLRVVEMSGVDSSVKDNASGDLDTRVGYVGISVAERPRFVETNP